MDKKSHSETIVIINCVLNPPLMLISIIGNALVLSARLRTPSLRSASTIFLSSLAVSDLLVGLVVQPVYIAYTFISSNPALFLAEDSLSFLACGVSLFTVAAISVDRFLALHYHMRYANLMTTKRAICISAAIWVICIILSCLSFWNRKVYFLVVAVGVALCLFISTFSYIRIYFIVRRHWLQIRVQHQAVESLNAEHNLNMVRSRKSAKNTFIYYICMILCYSPMFIDSSIYVVSEKSWTIVRALTTTTVFLNSSINPFLYCWRTTEIRMAVLKSLRRLFCKQTDA